MLRSAIEASPQQELSINQRAQRWTVQMYANKLGLPAAACTAASSRAVGGGTGVEGGLQKSSSVTLIKKREADIVLQKLLQANQPKLIKSTA